MHRFTSRAALALAAALALTACGSDNTAEPTTEFTGSVYAAPVAGATVTVRDSAGAVVGGPVTTGADGAFRVGVLDTALGGALTFEARDGHYVDEATGTTVAAGLRLAARRELPVAQTRVLALAPSTVVHLTPGSTLVRDLVAAGKTRAQAEAAMLATFGYVPDTTVAPSTAPGASYAARLAALRAGAFSHLTAAVLPGAPEKQAALLAALAADLADGSLNGLDAAAAPVAIDATANVPTDVLYRFATALKACGDAEAAHGASSTVVRTSQYTVEWVAGPAAPKMGRTAFQLRVTDAGGAAVSGATVTVVPKMFMTTKNHSAPVDVVAESATAGTYDAAVYFQMASGPTMGFWEVAVTVNGETACFYPDVAMSMGTTVVARLYGQADLIPTMTGGTQKRTYLIFNDGLAGMAQKTMSIFLAAPDDAEMMHFPAIGAGTTLHGGTGTAWDVTEVALQASSDGGTNWFNATATGVPGHYQVAGLEGLGSGGTVQVRVSVNGEAKKNVAGDADFAPFTIAAPGGMGGM